MLSRCALLAALFGTFTVAAHADNWPSWRGPTQNGISTEKNVPVRWDKSENVAWRTELPGPSGATPVVWGDKIFLTTVADNDLMLMCFSTDGKELWKHKMGEGNKKARGDEGNSSSPSPVTDGKHVWAMMGTGDVACCTIDGEEKWNLNLQKQYGKFEIQFGMTSTPVLHDGVLYFQMIHGKWAWKGESGPELGLLVAIDASTGKERWKVNRHSGATAENMHSYASPILYNFGGRKFLITHGGDYTFAHSLKDGSVIWKLGGMNPHGKDYHNTLRFVASPGVAEGIVVCPTAKKYPVFAVKADSKGDITGKNDAIHWVMKRNTPDVPSPLIHDGLVYLCRENGNLFCLDQKTGDLAYPEQKTNRQRHRASPVYANGHIYLAGRDGQVTVVKAGRDFEIVAKNKIGEQLSASPVVSNGTIYLRSFKALWAIRDGAKLIAK